MKLQEALQVAAAILESNPIDGAGAVVGTATEVKVTVQRAPGLSAWLRVSYPRGRREIFSQTHLSARHASVGRLKADLVGVEAALAQVLPMTVSTREDFLSKFTTPTEAIAFETYVLGSGREFLPNHVHRVLDGQEPTAEYWEFLIEQIATHEDAQMFLLRN